MGDGGARRRHGWAGLSAGWGLAIGIGLLGMVLLPWSWGASAELNGPLDSTEGSLKVENVIDQRCRWMRLQIIVWSVVAVPSLGPASR